MPTKTEYDTRSIKILEKYGRDAYKKWGKLGGNPILLKQSLKNKSRSK